MYPDFVLPQTLPPMRKFPRGSIEHYTQIREIDSRYNEVRDKEKLKFFRRHPALTEESPEWLEIINDIEEQRLHEFSVMRSFIID